MNREDEITKASLDFSPCFEYRREIFIKGAKWADKHPASPWHSVADGDLPPIDKVVLCTNGTDISLGVYNRHFYDPSPWKDCERLHLVKYWIEIPKLPTELK